MPASPASTTTHPGPAPHLDPAHSESASSLEPARSPEPARSLEPEPAESELEPAEPELEPARPELEPAESEPEPATRPEPAPGRFAAPRSPARSARLAGCPPAVWLGRPARQVRRGTRTPASPRARTVDWPAGPDPADAGAPVGWASARPLEASATPPRPGDPEPPSVEQPPEAPESPAAPEPPAAPESPAAPGQPAVPRRPRRRNQPPRRAPR